MLAHDVNRSWPLKREVSITLVPDAAVETIRSKSVLQVFVRDNNIDQALKALKRKMQREGTFREMKLRRFYEKPSEKATRERAESERRRRKRARKQAVLDGLIPAPKKRLDKRSVPARATLSPATSFRLNRPR
jgi:small subunit ribosomal protein S21